MIVKDLYKLFQTTSGLCTDTRKVLPDSIFFALQGDNFNGNEFAKEAIKQGCVYAVVDQKKYALDSKYILVNNVLLALQDLAKYHREKLTIPVIGITGTNGKTTSKELIASVLKEKYQIAYTKGNLNNHIGVPITLLSIKKGTEIAIIEMGANNIGEIRFLCDIAQPNLGVITNIGKAHLEGFVNLEGVLATKNELYEAIRLIKGTVFVNNNDAVLIDLSKGMSRITYGKNGDIHGKISSEDLLLSLEYAGLKIQSNLVGSYQFDNIMLALAIGDYFKIEKELLLSAIKKYIPSNNRSEIVETKKNTLILDAYNANPSSMEKMLKSFAKQNHKNKLCILGDMLELGVNSDEEHLSIIKLTKKLHLKSLFVGNNFYRVNNNSFKNIKDLKNYLEKLNIQGNTILLKGSRGIKLEKIKASL